MTFHKHDNPARDLRNRDWLAVRLDQNFEDVTFDGWPRLWSYHYPEQLLVAPTFEEQAELLANWVLERFDSLAGHPPPGSEDARESEVEV